MYMMKLGLDEYCEYLQHVATENTTKHIRVLKFLRGHIFIQPPDIRRFPAVSGEFPVSGHFQ